MREVTLLGRKKNLEVTLQVKFDSQKFRRIYVAMSMMVKMNAMLFMKSTILRQKTGGFTNKILIQIYINIFVLRHLNAAVLICILDLIVHLAKAIPKTFAATMENAKELGQEKAMATVNVMQDTQKINAIAVLKTFTNLIGTKRNCCAQNAILHVMVLVLKLELLVIIISFSEIVERA